MLFLHKIYGVLFLHNYFSVCIKQNSASQSKNAVRAFQITCTNCFDMSWKIPEEIADDHFPSLKDVFTISNVCPYNFFP